MTPFQVAEGAFCTLAMQFGFAELSCPAEKMRISEGGIYTNERIGKDL